MPYFRRWSTLIAPRAMVIALLLVAASCSRQPDSTLTLTIISPHGSDIRSEFQTAFSNWHRQKYGSPVFIQWPDIGGGGTGNIIHELEGRYEHDNSSPYDLVFGGGSATFEMFRARGFLQKPDLTSAVLYTVPHDIFGTELHGKDDLWIAATMSNFGIPINKQRIEELQLGTPRHWADLAAPEWFGNLSLADPSKSGSVLSSLDMIYAQYGWEKAWALSVEMFANAPIIRNAGADPADDVGSATAAAGIVIDFYGRKHVIRVGPRIMAFIVPEGGSTIDPDPIAVLKGAPHPTLAAHFIEFVISPDGQRLWTHRKGTPGGPQNYMLGRMSVLPALYENESKHMSEPTSPFASAEPLRVDPKAQGYRRAFLGDLIKSALIDNHDALLETRKAVLAAGDPPDLLARLTASPRFISTTVDASGNLIDGPERIITSADLAAVAEEYKPANKTRVQSAEHLQARLKSLWRSQFATRLEEVRTAAATRPCPR